MDQLSEWQHRESIDFWEPPGAKKVRIMVAPDTQEEFTDFLASSNIENEIIIKNVQRYYIHLFLRRYHLFITVRKRSLLDESQYDLKYRMKKQLQPLSNETDFNHFWSLEELHSYIDFLELEHSDLITTEIIGNSTEGRPLRIVNISLNGRGIVNGSRPIIFIDAGIHAREWVAHHAALYILKQLIENREQYKFILQAVDFVILPVVNPDGYQYTRDAVIFIEF